MQNPYTHITFAPSYWQNQPRGPTRSSVGNAVPAGPSGVICVVGCPSPPPTFPQRQQTYPVMRACPPAPAHTQLPSTALPKAPGQQPPWTGTAAWPGTLPSAPSSAPSTAQHPRGPHARLGFVGEAPIRVRGTPGQRPGRLRSDHLTPHPGWHCREHEREEPGPMGRQCGQLRGLSRHPSPPHSSLVPKVPLKGLEQDSLSEGLSHLFRSPTPHPQGQRTRPPITSVSPVFARDAKIPPLHFRGLVPCP